jgi:hypothetical protein
MGSWTWAAALIFLCFYCFPVALSAQASEPRLDSLEPSGVRALTAFKLILKGSGFTEGAEVFVQATTKPARYLKFETVYISAEELQIEFGFGLGLRPQSRAVYVQNPDGAKSKALELTVVPPGVPLEESDDKPETAESGNKDEEQPDAEEKPKTGGEAEAVPDGEPKPESTETAEVPRPRITGIQPAEVSAGVRFSLVILGEDFKDGAVLKIQANSKAGSYFPPSYDYREFEAEFLGESILEVTFDRGFYHDPPDRDLYVVNPDGGESNKVSLAVVPPGRGR